VAFHSRTHCFTHSHPSIHSPITHQGLYKPVLMPGGGATAAADDSSDALTSDSYATAPSVHSSLAASPTVSRDAAAGLTGVAARMINQPAVRPRGLGLGGGARRVEVVEEGEEEGDERFSDATSSGEGAGSLLEAGGSSLGSGEGTGAVATVDKGVMHERVSRLRRSSSGWLIGGFGLGGWGREEVRGQPHCNPTATPLQPHCNPTATPLQPHSIPIPTPLQPHSNPLSHPLHHSH